uniref:Uncharacterized protein n=1 Tax=Physcomitrium patens TaxID=3218 RepID=A0A2K1JMI7_PHYPA|nr:hypothetical protein PHYPA_017426 [Physcomitrium patens]
MELEYQFLLPTSKYFVCIHVRPRSSRKNPSPCITCASLHERPRNHLDFRHRLNSEGQGEGKVFEYSSACIGARF